MTATATEASTANANGETAGVFAVLEVAGQRIGVASTAMVQIIRCPGNLASVPGSHPALLGVTSYRGRAVPVVDLARWSQANTGGGTAGAASGHYLAILGFRNQWIGLCVDAVHEVVRVQAGAIERVSHQTGAERFFHSVAMLGAERAPLTLLDAEQLMRQSQVWAGEIEATDPEAESGTPPNTGNTSTYAVIRLGQRLYALPAEALAEVLTTPALQPVMASSGATGLLGVFRWRGRDVPVVNPLPALGDPQALEAAPWLALVQDAERCIALPCHGMEQVRRYAAASIQTAQPGSALCSDACNGIVLHESGEPIRIIHAPALLDHFNVSRISHNAAPSEQNRNPSGRNAVPLVVFQAGSRFAVTIDQLQEIMPLPAGFPPAVDNAVVQGSLDWRGQALPIVDLQRHLRPQAMPSTPPTRLLITRLANQAAALLVGDIDMLIPAHAGIQTQVPLPGGETMHMVSVNKGADRASYRLIDFRALPLKAA